MALEETTGRTRLAAPRRRGRRTLLVSAASVAAGLALWEMAARTLVDPFFLPPPSAVLAAGYDLLRRGVLLAHVASSMSRILAGFLLGSLMAIPLGLAIGASLAARAIADPYIHVLRFVPALSLTTLFLAWFGTGELSKILLVAYTTGFIVVVLAANGVVTTHPAKLFAARMLGASRMQTFLLVTAPAAMPSIYVGMRIGLANSFLVIVGVEMLAADSGIGYLIWTSRLYLRVDWMFVGIILLGLLGFASDRLLKAIASRLLRRYVRESAAY